MLPLCQCASPIGRRSQLCVSDTGCALIGVASTGAGVDDGVPSAAALVAVADGSIEVGVSLGGLAVVLATGVRDAVAVGGGVEVDELVAVALGARVAVSVAGGIVGESVGVGVLVVVAEGDGIMISREGSPEAGCTLALGAGLPKADRSAFGKAMSTARMMISPRARAARAVKDLSECLGSLGRDKLDS